MFSPIKSLSFSVAVFAASNAVSFADDQIANKELAREVQAKIQVVETQLAELRTLVSQLTGDYKAIQWNELGIKGADTKLIVQGAADRRGVRIDSVRDDSMAAKLKLQVGDVIIGHNEKQTETLEDLQNAMASEKFDKTRDQKLIIFREGNTRYVRLSR